jgi:predicted permease
VEVFHSLAPVFLIIFLGVFLRRTGFLSPGLIQGTNRLAYWIGLPSVLFHRLATSPVEFAEHGDAVFAMLLVTLACGGLGYAVAGAFGKRGGAMGTLVQASFRGNLAFIGLPVLFYSAGSSSPRSVAIGVVILGAIVPVYNVGSVTVLLAGQHRLGLPALRKVVAQLATNPLVIASLAGAGYSFVGWHLPLALDRTFNALGQMAMPLALLGIGGALDLRQVGRANFSPVLWVSSIKVAVAPLLGSVLAVWLALDGDELRAVCVYLAAPTAAASFVLADQLGGDRSLAAAAVALSTVLSLGSLWMVIWLVA